MKMLFPPLDPVWGWREARWHRRVRVHRHPDHTQRTAALQEWVTDTCKMTYLTCMSCSEARQGGAKHFLKKKIKETYILEVKESCTQTYRWNHTLVGNRWNPPSGAGTASGAGHAVLQLFFTLQQWSQFDARSNSWIYYGICRKHIASMPIENEEN